LRSLFSANDRRAWNLYYPKMPWKRLKQFVKKIADGEYERNVLDS